MSRLEGEAVVVTGGALGIGRACCERMAQASFVTGAELVIDGGYTAR